MLDQEIKSGLCCTTKLVEGMSQESARLLFDCARLKRGEGIELETQRPPNPEATTANSSPSADKAAEQQV